MQSLSVHFADINFELCKINIRNANRGHKRKRFIGAPNLPRYVFAPRDIRLPMQIIFQARQNKRLPEGSL